MTGDATAERLAQAEAALAFYAREATYLPEVRFVGGRQRTDRAPIHRDRGELARRALRATTRTADRSASGVPLPAGAALDNPS